MIKTSSLNRSRSTMKSRLFTKSCSSLCKRSHTARCQDKVHGRTPQLPLPLNSSGKQTRPRSTAFYLLLATATGVYMRGNRELPFLLRTSIADQIFLRQLSPTSRGVVPIAYPTIHLKLFLGRRVGSSRVSSPWVVSTHSSRQHLAISN